MKRQVAPKPLHPYWLPANRRIWVLFQDSNGDKESKRYCFWFDSRKKAREYRAWVNSHPEWAQVSHPIAFVKELGWREVKKALDRK